LLFDACWGFGLGFNLIKLMGGDKELVAQGKPERQGVNFEPER